MKKSYKFRIYPNKTTEAMLDMWLDRLRFLYNCALEHRITCYKHSKKSISYLQQAGELKDIKTEFPEYKEVFAQSIQGSLKKLDRAFQNFFRRCKTGKTPGFPRFQGYDRFNSFTFPQYPSGCKIKDGKLIVTRIGSIRIKKHRPIEGIIKTTTIKRMSSGKWFVIFSCDDVSTKLLPKINKAVGIDMGLKSFLTTSDGNKISNPRFLKLSQDVLTARQQKFSTKKRGSNNRQKQKNSCI